MGRLLGIYIDCTGEALADQRVCRVERTPGGAVTMRSADEATLHAIISRYSADELLQILDTIHQRTGDADERNVS